MTERHPCSFADALEHHLNAVPTSTPKTSAATHHANRGLWRDQGYRARVEFAARALWNLAGPSSDPVRDAEWLIESALDQLTGKPLSSGAVVVACEMSGLRSELVNYRKAKIWADVRPRLYLAAHEPCFRQPLLGFNDEGLRELLGREPVVSMDEPWPGAALADLSILPEQRARVSTADAKGSAKRVNRNDRHETDDR